MQALIKIVLWTVSILLPTETNLSIQKLENQTNLLNFVFKDNSLQKSYKLVE